jgi:hypothetical protein
MDNRFFYQSGLIAFGVYFSFLITLIVYFGYTKNKDKVYSFRQDTSFEISIDILQKNENLKISKQKKDNFLKNETKILKENGSLTHKRGVDINSLFKNIKDDTFEGKLEDYMLNTSKSSKISRKYGQKNQTITEQLSNIEKALEKIKLPSYKTKNIIYNKYYSKISKLLTIEFNRQVLVKGIHKAIVLVTIDAKGHFTYLIDEYSDNNFFNIKLEEFLEEVSTRMFPIYEKGKTIIKVIFKTED